MACIYFLPGEIKKNKERNTKVPLVGKPLCSGDLAPSNTCFLLCFFSIWLMPCYSLQHSLSLWVPVLLPVMMRLWESQEVRNSRNHLKPRASTKKHLVCLPNEQRVWLHPSLAEVVRGFLSLPLEIQVTLGISTAPLVLAGHSAVAPCASPPTWLPWWSQDLQGHEQWVRFPPANPCVFLLRFMAAPGAWGLLGRSRAVFFTMHSQPPGRKASHWVGVIKSREY